MAPHMNWVAPHTLSLARVAPHMNEWRHTHRAPSFPFDSFHLVSLLPLFTKMTVVREMAVMWTARTSVLRFQTFLSSFLSISLHMAQHRSLSALLSFSTMGSLPLMPRNLLPLRKDIKSCMLRPTRSSESVRYDNYFYLYLWFFMNHIWASSDSLKLILLSWL